MNYIITENRINELKIKHLNTYVNNNVFDVSNFVVVQNNTEEGEFENLEPFFEYDHEDGRLYINSNIRDLYMSLFGSNSSEADEFISNWFSDKFGVTVDFTA
jgi:hypothetical protein